MKLEGKKELAARALKVGAGRIVFNKERLSEIKEAITKQDMKDLFGDKAISISEIKGRKKIEKKSRRRAGSIKQTRKKGKQEYVKITRKLRKHIAELRENGKMGREDSIKLRKEIRAREFRSLSHMKERVAHLGDK